jgi:predicted AlkP superfamily pyrophosphatase or phosphodiesterase
MLTQKARLTSYAALLAGAVVLAACAAVPARPGPARALDHVVIVSVDGLMPATYLEPDLHGLAVPVLRELARTGAASPGVLSVWPSITYPAHTTIATGADPGLHGIVSNVAWDPEERNKEGWWWYAEDIRVPTLWSVAAASGLKTALVNWPVTVGARATALVPEYWRAGTPDDAKLSRALSTPGLFEAVVARHPDFWQRFTPPKVKDQATADLVVHLLETVRPALLMAHIWQTDDAQHAEGPWSPRAIAALENADQVLGRILAAARAMGPWERTAVVVVSDHGFTRAERQLRPGVLLREAGLVTLSPDGHPASWRAVVTTHGGLAHLYARDGRPDELRRLFDPLAGVPGSGIARVYSAAEIQAHGGDPRATLAIGAAEGFVFTAGYQGEATAPAGKPGHHGFDPGLPAMRASLLITGGAIAPGRLDGARLVDVAPTVARWLGLSLPTATGRPLPVRLTR